MSVDDVTVKGYWHNQIHWAMVEDPRTRKVKITAQNFSKLAFEGVEVQVELKDDNASIKASSIRYAFLIDASKDAIKKAKQEVNEKEEGPVIGVCKMGRIDPQTEKVGEIRSFHLFDLDSQHLLDRLTSETLRWHAESFGPGPANPKARAKWVAKQLSQNTVKAPTTKRRSIRL